MLAGRHLGGQSLKGMVSLGEVQEGAKDDACSLLPSGILAFRQWPRVWPPAAGVPAKSGRGLD